MNRNDLVDVLTISRTAFECLQVDELRKAVLPLVEKAFQIDSGNFFMARNYPSPRLDLDGIVSTGLDNHFVELFRQYYYTLDPFYGSLHDDQAVVTTEHVVRPKDLLNTEYYNDFLKPQSIKHQMAIYLKSHGRLLGTIALFRPHNKPAFSTNERSKAELIATYLSGALEKAIFADKVKKCEQIIDSIAPDLPYKGIIALDGALDPVYSSFGGARNTIAANKTEPAHSIDEVPREVFERCRTLRDSMRQKSQAACQDATAGSCEAKLPAGLRVIEDRGRSMFLFCMAQEGSETRIAAALANLGLSRREQEITLLVSKGFKNKEIAEQLFISEYTVENHLRSIYEKTGVKNRTSLAHRVNGLLGPAENASL